MASIKIFYGCLLFISVFVSQKMSRKRVCNTVLSNTKVAPLPKRKYTTVHVAQMFMNAESDDEINGDSDINCSDIESEMESPDENESETSDPAGGDNRPTSTTRMVQGKHTPTSACDDTFTWKSTMVQLKIPPSLKAVDSEIFLITLVQIVL